MQYSFRIHFASVCTKDEDMKIFGKCPFSSKKCIGIRRNNGKSWMKVEHIRHRSILLSGGGGAGDELQDHMEVWKNGVRGGDLTNFAIHAI